MTAPFFALSLLPEPELFLLFRPSLGRAPGAAVRAAFAASRWSRLGLAGTALGRSPASAAVKGRLCQDESTHWYTWASEGSAPNTTRAA